MVRGHYNAVRSIAASLLLLGLITVPALALGQIRTLLNQAPRQAGATFTSPTIQLPANANTIYINLTMPEADRENENNSVTWYIEVSPDGTNWQMIHLEYWTGGTMIDKHTGLVVGRPSQVEESIDPSMRGWLARGHMVVNTAMTVGVEGAVQ